MGKGHAVGTNKINALINLDRFAIIHRIGNVLKTCFSTILSKGIYPHYSSAEVGHYVGGK